MAMNPPFHADHVGSLRRPQPLIEAHSSCLQGKLKPQALKELEDKAIDDAIAMQERVGTQAITDGEMRRNNWRDRFFERVDGFSREKISSSFVFTDYSGKQYTGMPIPVVVGKLQWRESLTADDFGYLKARTKRTAKATLPSPSANQFDDFSTTDAFPVAIARRDVSVDPRVPSLFSCSDPSWHSRAGPLRPEP
jgi:5-methyltetrahydropteroyltriglutamate--homocysteine methyltransferase